MLKKTLGLFTVVCIMTLIFTVFSPAQVMIEKRFGIGGRVAYMVPMKDNLKSAIAYEGLVTYGVSNVFATELSYGYSKPDLIHENFGEAKIRYLNLSFQLRGEPEPYFGLYLGVGPTLFFNGYQADQAEAQDVHAKDTFGLHVDFGFDYFITRSLVFNLDVKWLWYKYEYQRSLEGETDELDAQSWVCGAGLKWFF